MSASTSTPEVAAPAVKPPSKLIAWATSSSTILGASTLLGLASAVLGGQMTWQVAIGPAVGAVAAVAWPQLQAPTRTEIESAVSAAVTGRFTMARPGPAPR